jgi:hypothetical protein
VWFSCEFCELAAASRPYFIIVARLPDPTPTPQRVLDKIVISRAGAKPACKLREQGASLEHLQQQRNSLAL